jgi:Na+-translocating ferredoxin:NAD+ oxidoreductase subunit G
MNDAAQPLSAPQRSRRGGVILFLFAAIGTALLSFTFKLTEETIIQREDEEKLLIVDQILPRDVYDNRVLRDWIKIPPDEKLLKTNEITKVYRARKAGQPAAALLEAVGPNGYGGKIRLILAIRADGELLGTRVLAHNETVGWGDYIEAHKNKWINIFSHTSLERYQAKDWQVRKDGGRFDYVTRSTVSARAVVAAAHRALQYYEQNKSNLFVQSR